MSSIHLPFKIAAIGISKTGDVDVIQNLELPLPSPTPIQFIIKVEYAGVNFLDIQQRAGSAPLPPLPAALGLEAAGTIAALPTDETVLNSEAFQKGGFQVGSKVACFGISAGTFAEYTVADWGAVIPLPPTLSTRVGAAGLVHGLTALSFASEAQDVRAGDRVLVHTVAGGLGLWFAQLCKQRGAVVIGTTSTVEKAALARAHGADHVILYRDEDVAARVLEITGGEGVDAIFDGVGKDTFETNLKVIRVKGTIVAMGTASGKIEAFDPKVLYTKNVKFVCPSAEIYVAHPAKGRNYGQELVDLLASGAVKSIITKEYPLTAEGVAQAQEDIARGRSAGKLLIKVASN